MTIFAFLKVVLILSSQITDYQIDSQLLEYSKQAYFRYFAKIVKEPLIFMRSLQLEQRLSLVILRC